MKSERFSTIDRLYHAALAIEPQRRAAFLKEACRGDETLQSEVESLLALAQQSARLNEPPINTESLGRDDDPAAAPGNRASRRLRPLAVVAGRFEIIQFIGQGGMGDVYEARDLDLQGRVALKTIRPDFSSDERMIARFKHEILLAKRVTHPNVCRIYDLGFHYEHNEQDRSLHQPGHLGTMFLTMELLHGETLSARLRRGPMTPSEALPLIEQMAAGLNAAHQVGVVHRDFKCANVMLVSEENEPMRAVITDFGLARNLALRADETLTASITQGEIAGTPDYMAPEQVVGGKVTPALDIYALGVVMYEMLTGRRPFEADTPFAVAAKRLHEDPPSPRRFTANLDRRWEAVILRSLEREPARRFASATEIVQALTGPEAPRLPVRPAISRRAMFYAGITSTVSVAGAVAAWRLLRTNGDVSIAVLPFVNTDSSLDYMSDGVTEDLTNTLGQTPGLRVTARATVYRFRGSNPGVQELGEKLKVRYLLTGRMVQSGEYMTTAVELTDTRSGAHVWGQQYRRRGSEISAVEEDIAREILKKLQPRMGNLDERPLLYRRKVSAEANEYYWKGRFFWNKRTQEGLKKGIEYFTLAIAKDPGFALAYTGLADCYSMQSGIAPPMEVFPKAKAAAHRALQLEERLAEAHASLAFTMLFFEWDWLQTEKEYRRAIQLNPNYASAHSMYAMYLVAMKRFGEARAEMKRALELDPASLAINTGVGRVLFYERRYRDAAAQYTKTLEMNPEFSEALFDLGRTLAAQGNYDGAAAMIERGLKAAREDAGALADIAWIRGRAKRTAQAEQAVLALQALSTKRYVSPYFFAVAHSGTRDDVTLEFLEQAWRERAFSMIYLNVDPRFDNLRAHARYRRLLEQLGFSS